MYERWRLKTTPCLVVISLATCCYCTATHHRKKRGIDSCYAPVSHWLRQTTVFRSAAQNRLPVSAASQSRHHIHWLSLVIWMIEPPPAPAREDRRNRNFWHMDSSKLYIACVSKTGPCYVFKELQQIQPNINIFWWTNERIIVFYFLNVITITLSCRKCLEKVRTTP